MGRRKICLDCDKPAYNQSRPNSVRCAECGENHKQKQQVIYRSGSEYIEKRRLKGPEIKRATRQRALKRAALYSRICNAGNGMNVCVDKWGNYWLCERHVKWDLVPYYLPVFGPVTDATPDNPWNTTSQGFIDLIRRNLKELINQ